VVWETIDPSTGSTLLVEVIRPPRRIAIFGSGADVDPVARLASQLGWEVEIIATRQGAARLEAIDAAVVMTHNFLRDLELLEVLATSSVTYVGLLGPKSRGEELLAAMTNVPPDFRERLHNPIGLDLGGETPEEIALAIIAEVQQAFERRSGRPLRERGTPIHAGELTDRLVGETQGSNGHDRRLD
jgi:xanthine/CO dehydrogenase XdhC/CoxF family maturation factor